MADALKSFKIQPNNTANVIDKIFYKLSRFSCSFQHKLDLVLTLSLRFQYFCRTKVVNARLLDMASRPTSAVIVELHLDENTLHPSLFSLPIPSYTSRLCFPILL